MQGQSNPISTVVQTIKVYYIELFGLIVLGNEVVMSEYNVVVELLADYPNGEDGVLQVFPHLDVF
jgi:hypothetical protein